MIEPDQKQEVIQSVTSYGIGCTAAICSWLVNLAEPAQALAIILGCLIVAVRLSHDIIALIRFIRNK